MTALRWYLAPFISRPLALVGLMILIAICVGAVFAPLLAPYDPSKLAPNARLLPPSAAHWFGTDQFGRDTLSRVIYGSRLALVIGIGVVSFALMTGVPAGIFSALFPRVGRIVMRMIDVLMSFPALLLALGLIVILGRGVSNAIIAIGVVYLTTTCRITYGLALRLRTETYVEAANSLGAGVAWTIRKHILPNLISPLLVLAVRLGYSARAVGHEGLSEIHGTRRAASLALMGGISATDMLGAVARAAVGVDFGVHDGGFTRGALSYHGNRDGLRSAAS